MKKKLLILETANERFRNVRKSVAVDDGNGYIDIAYTNLFGHTNTYSVRRVDANNHEEILNIVEHLSGKVWCNTDIITDYIHVQRQNQ
jgi:hypothetical protein